MTVGEGVTTQRRVRFWVTGEKRLGNTVGGIHCTVDSNAQLPAMQHKLKRNVNVFQEFDSVVCNLAR